MIATMGMHSARLRQWQWLFLAGLLAGALDILYAIGVWGLQGIPAQRILQSIASGVLGKASFIGGANTAVLGLALHMLIALAMAAVYFIAARKWLVLVRRPSLCGTLYGVLLFVAMNFVVVPLSAAPMPPPKDLASIVIALLPHVLLVGLPIAWLARLALRGHARIHAR